MFIWGSHLIHLYQCAHSTPPAIIRRPQAFLLVSGIVILEHWPEMG